MTLKALKLTIASLVLATGTFAAGPKETATVKTTVNDYIKKWSSVAKSNMTKYRIPASITLAQGILESGYGNSRMAKMANNHFGIKCLGWKGEGYYQQSSQKSCYRKYRDSEECFQDHARIISSKDRYSFLFNLDITDYRAWAKGLKKAGYATDGEYDQLLIKTIEEYKLYAIDLQIAKPGKKRIKTPPRPVQPVEMELPKKESAIEMIDRITKDIIIQVDDQGELLEEAQLIVMPEPDDYEVHEVEVELTVATKHVKAVSGDTYSSIALSNGLKLQDVLRFNDLEKELPLLDGDVVYLNEKQREASSEMYTLRPTQSLWDVAQKYGIKLHSLERMNGFKHNEPVASGTVLRLR